MNDNLIGKTIEDVEVSEDQFKIHFTDNTQINFPNNYAYYDFSKTDYSLPIEHSMYDTSYCTAPCITECARRKPIKSALYIVTSNFSKTCTKFKGEK